MPGLIASSTDASPLSSLPAELILMIAEFLEYENQINNFSRVSCRFYHLLNPFLYRHDVVSGSRLALRWASTHGQEPVVQKALKAGATPTVYDAASAACNGHDHLLKLFIERGVDLNAPMHYRGNLADPYSISSTLLANAANSGHQSTVRLLLESGAKIETPPGSDDEPPALIQAVYWRRHEVVRVLVDAGADVNATDNHGLTALYFAASRGHIDTVKFLLQRGADLDKGPNGILPISAAVQEGRIDIIQCLLDHGASVRYNLLVHAAYMNHASTVKLLLRHLQAMPDSELEPEQLALLAAGTGLTPIITELINRGWDANSYSVTRQTEEETHFVTPLLYAAKNGHVDIVRLLLSHGANPNRDNHDYDHPLISPLRHAVEQGHEDVVRVLLEHNASLYISEVHYILNDAIPHDAIFKLLLDHEADPHELDLEAVMLAGDPAKLQILIDAGLDFKLRGSRLDSECSTTKSFPIVLAKSNEAIVRTVFAHGHRPVPVGKGSDYDDSFYLQAAALEGNVALFECLKEIGFDARIHCNGYRLFENAACVEDYHAAGATVDWLLQQGVDMESRGPFDRTPLLSVVQNSRMDPIHATRVLLDRGADPCYESEDEDCPLLQAVVRGGNLALLVDLIDAIDRKGNIPFSVLGPQILRALSFIEDEDPPLPGSTLYRIERMLNNFWWRKFSERPREEWGPGVSDWAI
ncbi:uncharacterized protein DSM5745_09744 [Aspergillus mulundensis]|uniref:F-box domain-containing protein n=1 Tax=Aspergillus mulundensis TaxID=1810919 RepID=A0A3D8QR91_9EURO|nr:hypothetical protein DSM5745_09744 [Aspergillus mulundensis]RDW64333.1 hypothetical protein DSM5745_09744 [Aspergillus mulundensis]